jgi:hypothetical protein
VRYIIDYYDDDNAKGAKVVNNFLESQSIWIDVRPALDSWGAIVDRAKMFFYRNVNPSKLDELSK